MTAPITGAQRCAHPGPVVAVFRHQWRQLVHSPLTSLLQIVFLAGLSVCIFVIADFYATDTASIEVMLTFLPWIALILVPALAMRAFVDRPGDRELELVSSLPVSSGSVVLGQWLAGGAVLMVTLVFTLPFAATVAFLGDPDWGVILAGYLAGALLLLAFYAVALFASALMREQIGSFALGLGLLFGLMLVGWDAAARLVRGLPAGAWLDVLATASPKYALDRMATGEIKLGSVASFALVTALALYGASAVIEARKRTRSAWVAVRGVVSAVGLSAAALLALAALREAPLALDLTAEKEFTLSSGTLAVLGRLPKDTVISFYWSEGEASVPPSIRAHARRARDLLSALVARSAGRARLIIEDPKPDSEAELRALAAGLRRIPMTSGDWFMLGAAVRTGDRQDRIAYLDIRRERLLEHDLAVVLNNLGRSRPSRVGILSPLLTPSNVSEPREGLSVLEEVKRTQDVAIVPHFGDKVPDGLDALLVVDASVLKREMLYSIDQQVMRGMSLIVLMDPHLRMNPASDQVTPQPSEEVNDISDLLLRYGIRYQGEDVVGDARLAAPVVDEAQRPLSYPYWLKIGRAGLSATHPVTTNVNELLFAEPGAFVIEPGRPGAALVVTTDAAGSLPRKEFAGKSPGALAAGFRSGGGSRVLAAQISGAVESAFDRAPDGADPAPHLTRSSERAEIFAVADVDWIFDPFAFEEVRSGDEALSRPVNGNSAFLLGMVDAATGDPDLIAIRSRGRLHRPFTRVAELLQAASQRYRDQESQIMERITKVEAEIARVPEAAGVARLDQLPADVQTRITAIREGLLPFRLALREIRRKAREGVEGMTRWLMLMNFAAGPFLVLGFAGLIRATRYPRRRRDALKIAAG